MEDNGDVKQDVDLSQYTFPADFTEELFTALSAIYDTENSRSNTKSNELLLPWLRHVKMKTSRFPNNKLRFLALERHYINCPAVPRKIHRLHELQRL